MEDWLLATLSAPPDTAEAVSAALFEAGAGAVWEDQPDSKGRVVMKSAFPQGQEMQLMADLPGAIRQITEAMSLAFSDFSLVLELRAGEDHSESWKKDLKPIQITERFIIAPSWWTDPLPGADDAKVLRLDPGAAFGSGHHPTTYMCLKFLCAIAQSLPQPSSILDLGTGSGVLALSAALLLNQASLTAIDNDPETAFASSANLSLNNLTDKIELQTTTINQIEGSFDLIMANLTRNTLIELSKEIAKKTKTSGRLIVSGLIENQVPDIIKTFNSNGFTVERHLGLNEWSALLMVNTGSSSCAPQKDIPQKELIEGLPGDESVQPSDADMPEEPEAEDNNTLEPEA
jgi:ribosomal protein L11 methyltransferase